MPLRDAISLAVLNWPTLFLCVYLTGLVVTARRRDRLGSRGKYAIWGYGLLSAGTVASIAASTVAMTLRGALTTSDHTPLFVFSVSSLVLSLLGALLVLLAVVGVEKR